MKFSQYLTITILVVIFIYSSEYVSVSRHEYAHKQIFSYYGYNSTIEIDLLKLEGATTPTTEIPEEDWRELRFLHSLNEIFSYNCLSIRLILYMILYIVLIIAVIVANIHHQLIDYWFR